MVVDDGRRVWKGELGMVEGEYGEERRVGGIKELEVKEGRYGRMK